MRGALVLSLVATIVVVGCASSHGRHPTAASADVSGPVVPWTAALPTQMSHRPPAAARCRAAQLRLPGEVRFVPRLNGGIALVTLSNVGRHACRLAGRPRVHFVHKGGPAQVQSKIAPTPSTFPEVPYPPSSLLALPPGESGAVTVTWDNWCDLKVPGKPHVPPSAIRMVLPHGGGSLDTDYNAVPQCVDPTAPSTIGVSDFQPSLIPTGRPWTDAFLRASIPDQPLRVQRGRVLRFHVVLKNLSKTTARFGRCPAYAQQLVPAGRVKVYSLNCSAARPIRPGASLAFAMRLDVPRDAPPGHNGLFWMLDPFGQQGPELNVRVDVGR